MKLKELHTLVEGRKRDSFDDFEDIRWDLRHNFSDGNDSEYQASHSDSPAGLLNNDWQKFILLRRIATRNKGIFQSKAQAEGILSYLGADGKADLHLPGTSPDRVDETDTADVHVEADSRGITLMVVTHNSDGKVDIIIDRSKMKMEPRDMHYDDDVTEARFIAKEARALSDTINDYQARVDKDEAEVANIERQLKKKAAAASTDEKQIRITADLQKKLERHKYYIERNTAEIAKKKKEFASLKRKLDKHRKGPK